VGWSACPLCGENVIIKENFMPCEMDFKYIDVIVGDPGFELAYGDGLYSTGNNHCDCKNLPSSFNSAETACGCAFPVSVVTPSKRDLGLEETLDTKRGVAFNA
jgi:hypothetical protein